MKTIEAETPSNDHRAMLRDSVADFAARASDIARVRRLRGDAAEYDRAVWRRMAELGWLGILVPEQYGGLGLALAEAAIVAEGLARGLAPEPFTAAAVLAVEAIAGGDNEAFKQQHLPRVVDGSLLPVLAWQERAGEVGPAGGTTQASPFEGGWRVGGVKRFVSAAAGADAYLVSAATSQGVALFWVDRGAPGVALELEPLADGRHFGTLTLKDVTVPRGHMVASASVAAEALARALDHATVICSAELVGVMSRTLEMSLDYLRTRKQFGKAIGSFQALQHRAVDLYIQRELASAVLEEAIGALDGQPDAARRAMLASRAKARSTEAGLRITREAIQIHGAIGFTDEYDAGLYLKRALVLAAWLGNATWHRRRYGALAARTDA
ncbi:MAG: acyl-CoA/acyl-ACP dehydrogenase [Betaproteobacteria bacterium]|nr:acyl-CoA/acyl-ACP dehydrogenase [Betaproteobacteria bacterium]